MPYGAIIRRVPPAIQPPDGGERRRHSRAARRAQIRRQRLAVAGVLALLVALALIMVAVLDTGAHPGASSPGTPSKSSRSASAAGGSPGAAARRGSARATASTGADGATTGNGGAASVAGGELAGAAETAETAEIRSLIALGKPIYCAGDRGRDVALTFDDGPGPYTRLVLAKLRKHHIPATFFVVGRNIDLIPGATRQERAVGAVGDHTYTHPLLTGLAPSEAEREIVRTKDALQRSTGGPIFMFRPPYGGRNATIDNMARANGLLEIMWTVDSEDSLGANYAKIERNVIAGMRPGAIILMHENHGQTVRALLSIFAVLQRKHLRPVTVPQLLTEDPPSPARVRAGGLGCGVPRGGASNGG